MTRPSLSALVLLSCLIPTMPATGQSVTLPVLEDSWIHGLGSSSTQGGTSAGLSICPSANYWIYLKFDLSGIAGQIADAEVRLTRFSGSRPEEISLYFIGDDGWSEATLAGTARPEPVSPAPAEALAVGEAAAGHDRWSSPKLVAAVQQEAGGDGVLTLMVREDPSARLDVRNFYSREGARSDGEKPQLVVTLEPTEMLASGWQTVEVAAGIKPAFDFGADGRVHVMGMTEELNGVVWYAVADSLEGPWKSQTIASGYFYGPGDLRVDPQGVAHVAWHNHDHEDPNHATVDGGRNVRIFRIESPSTHNGWDNSLALDGAGGLHQSSVNPSGFGATTSLEYGTFNGQEWSYEEVPGSGSFMYGLATSIAVDGQGQPHIVYCQAQDWTAPGELKYAVRSAEGWRVATVVSGGPRGRFPALALDHWGRPHVVWLDVDGNDPSRAFVRYGVFNADMWEIEDVDTLESVELSMSGARKSVSIALDRNWRPHVAYGDERLLKYAVKPFGTWQITTVLEHPGETYKGLVVLRLDSNDRPALAFWERHPTLAGLVRLAFPTPPAPGPQRPGDCTQDGVLNLSDAVCLLGHLFLASPSVLPCGDGTITDSANASLLDANGDSRVDLSDAVGVLGFLFLGRPAPVLGTDCVTIAGCPEACR